jgi:hypothetical protein
MVFKCKQPGAQRGILLISMHLLPAGVGDSGCRPPATGGQSDLPPWQAIAGGNGASSQAPSDAPTCVLG